MTTETDMAATTLGTLVLRLLLIDLIQIGIKNLHSVKEDFYARSVHFNLLPVPFARRLKVSPLGRF